MSRTLPPALLALLACCAAPRAEYPVTETARPLTAQNARLAGAAPPVLRTVTADRLVRARAEPQNWLTYYGAYDGQRYSALDQIDTANVARLRPAWIFQHDVLGLIASPAGYAMEAAPIVVDGVMYVSGYDGYVWALNAATGAMLWQYHHATPLDVPACCGNVNRGVAVAEGKVFVATLNAHLIALDGVSGRVVWDQAFADVRAGETATGAPLVVKNLVLVGSAGAEYGVRGHIDAFDVATGRRAWRRYNVPAPGEPGSETWPGTDAWARGGGAAWTTGTYDPALDLVYWGTANPGPNFDGGVREGDNLYTSSIIAFRPGDGRLVWHYQTTPHDVWDYDATSEPILFDAPDGRRLLAQFNKNGHLYVLDRANGRLLHATPFARVTWAEVERTTGKVHVRLRPTPEGTYICPGLAGAKEWTHASYSRATGLLYAPAIDLCATYRSARGEFREGLSYWGGSFMPDPRRQSGSVEAVDPATGRIVWTWKDAHPVVASVLTTAGGLVFVGRATGEFAALDARSGRLLWQFQTGSGIHSSPTTYSAGGKQYIAVPSGWGGAVKGFAPELAGAPRGGAIVAFALP